jgi:prepilin-type N-terminal cleavage/methylation domain-containing protein
MALRQKLLKRFHGQQAGFTLPELLIAAALGSLLILVILQVIVDLMRSDRDEQIRSQMQGEAAQAIDYIREDLKGAVYVYSDLSTLDEGIPTNLTSSGLEPVLAFWKLKRPYDSPTDDIGKFIDNLNCTAQATAVGQTDCLALKEYRSFYTLVVYVFDPSSSSTYGGKARIRRYELPKFTQTVLSNSSLTRTTGFVDPMEAGASILSTWPYADQAKTINCQNDASAGVCNLSVPAGGRPTATLQTQAPVLIDYLDDPTSSRINPPACPTTKKPPPDAAEDAYKRIPSSSTDFRSFFVCVADGGSTDPQDVVLFLRTSPLGKGGKGRNGFDLPDPPSIPSDKEKERQFVQELQTRICKGGVITTGETENTSAQSLCFGGDSK